MADDPQLCGAVDEIDYGVWFECGLRPGHAGDHEDVHRWQNEPHGPKPAPKVPRNRFVPASWAEELVESMLSQLANAAALGSPFVNTDSVALQVVNRDWEG